MKRHFCPDIDFNYLIIVLIFNFLIEVIISFKSKTNFIKLFNKIRTFYQQYVIKRLIIRYYFLKINYFLVISINCYSPIASYFLIISYSNFIYSFLFVNDLQIINSILFIIKEELVRSSKFFLIGFLWMICFY